MVVLFFMGLLFFLVFAVSPQLRHRVCANWLVTLVVVEAQVLAISLLCVRSHYILIMLGFVIVLVIMIVVLIAVFYFPVSPRLQTVPYAYQFHFACHTD